MDSLLGRRYYPKDTSFAGIYKDKVLHTLSFDIFGSYLPTMPEEFTLTSEPFVDSVTSINKKELVLPFIKAESYGIVYRLLWNPAWLKL